LRDAIAFFAAARALDAGFQPATAATTIAAAALGYAPALYFCHSTRHADCRGYAVMPEHRRLRFSLMPLRCISFLHGRHF